MQEEIQALWKSQDEKYMTLQEMNEIIDTKIQESNEQI